MIVSTWISTKLCSSDRVERHFAYLIAFVVGMTVLYAMIKPVGPIFLWGAPLCSLWASLLIIFTLWNLYCEHSESQKYLEITRAVQFVLLMLVALIYYDGTNVANRYRYKIYGDSLLYDEQLLMMDNTLLGWIFPQGQLALYLDTNEQIGVKSYFGHVYAEILQLLYVSYYFWGNVLGVYLALIYWKAVWNQEKSAKKKMQYRRIQMFVTAWAGGFLFNFFLNLLFPAVSPRIYIRDSYINEVEGLWFTGTLRGALTSAASGTYSAFPSGHCGQSWLAAFLAYRMGFNKYAYLNIFNAILISASTLILRYHYFVDFLFSVTTILFGIYLGSFHDANLYTRLLSRNGQVAELQDLLEKGEKGLFHSPSSNSLLGTSNNDKLTTPTSGGFPTLNNRSGAVQPLLELVITNGNNNSKQGATIISLGETMKQQQD